MVSLIAAFDRISDEHNLYTVIQTFIHITHGTLTTGIFPFKDINGKCINA
jgi:hypothetical protein